MDVWPSALNCCIKYRLFFFFKHICAAPEHLHIQWMIECNVDSVLINPFVSGCDKSFYFYNQTCVIVTVG